MYLSAQLPLVFLRNLCGLSHWLTEEKARFSQVQFGPNASFAFSLPISS